MHDLSEPGVAKPIKTPDGDKFLHINISAGHARRVDMEMDNLPDQKRVPVGTEFDHVMHSTFELDRHLADTRRQDFDGP